MSKCTRAAAVAVVAIPLLVSPANGQRTTGADTLRRPGAQELQTQRRAWLEARRSGLLGDLAPAYGSAVVGAPGGDRRSPRANRSAGEATGYGEVRHPFSGRGGPRSYVPAWGYGPASAATPGYGFPGYGVPGYGFPGYGPGPGYWPGPVYGPGSGYWPVPGYGPLPADERVPGYGITPGYGGVRGNSLSGPGPSFGQEGPLGEQAFRGRPGGMEPGHESRWGRGSPWGLGGVTPFTWSPWGLRPSFPFGISPAPGMAWNFGLPGTEFGSCARVQVLGAGGYRYGVTVWLQPLGLGDEADLELAIDERLSGGQSMLLYGVDGRVLRLDPGPALEDVRVLPCDAP